MKQARLATAPGHARGVPLRSGRRKTGTAPSLLLIPVLAELDEVLQKLCRIEGAQLAEGLMEDDR